jgi:hypothetical protein
MAGRIIEMREALKGELESLGTPGDWSHITKQIGELAWLVSLLVLIEGNAKRREDRRTDALLGLVSSRHVLLHRT